MFCTRYEPVPENSNIIRMYRCTQNSYDMISQNIIDIFTVKPNFDLQIEVVEQGTIHYYTLSEFIKLAELETKIVRLTMQYMEKEYGAVEFHDTKRAI
jgi:hypothetical protein